MFHSGTTKPLCDVAMKNPGEFMQHFPCRPDYLDVGCFAQITQTPDR